CRNGTMASPLPNTNNPAAAKYQKTFQSTPRDATPLSPVTSHVGQGATRRAREGNAGRVRRRASTGTKPDARNSHTLSDAVQLVTTRLTAKRPQRRRSRPSVTATSLVAPP